MRASVGLLGVPGAAPAVFGEHLRIRQALAVEHQRIRFRSLRGGVLDVVTNERQRRCAFESECSHGCHSIDRPLDWSGSSRH